MIEAFTQRCCHLKKCWNYVPDTSGCALYRIKLENSTKALALLLTKTKMLKRYEKDLKNIMLFSALLADL